MALEEQTAGSHKDKKKKVTHGSGKERERETERSKQETIVKYGGE